MEVVKDITPTEEEVKDLKKMSEKIIDQLYNRFKENNLIPPVVDILQVGSTDRNTNLKDDYDIDIFVRFDKNTEKELIGKYTLSIGAKVIEDLGGNWWVEYAEHPYLSGKIGKYDIDIVPCYKIEWGEKIISAVDRTPLHNEFVKKTLEKIDKIKNNKNYNNINNINNNYNDDENYQLSIYDEVRLLKKFLKGTGLYGSDLKTKGFSGYLCELLIIYSGGSFLNLLKDSENWKSSKKIILKEIYELYDLNNYKFKDFEDPLIVYDPVDLNRNVAAALSKNNYCKFIHYSYLFNRTPSKSFFYNYVDIIKNKLNDRFKGYTLTLCIKRPSDLVDDIIYPQMEKLQRGINKLLVENDFQYITWDIDATENLCYLSWEFLVWKLPNVNIKVGPPIFNKKNVDKFISKNDRYFIEDCRLYAYTERKYTYVDDLFRDLIDGKLKGKVPYPKNINPENGFILKNNVPYYNKD